MRSDLFSARLNSSILCEFPDLQHQTSFSNEHALLLPVLNRYLMAPGDTVEKSCAKDRGGVAQKMAEGIAMAFLKTKREQLKVARVLYLIATKLDGNTIV